MKEGRDEGGGGERAGIKWRKCQPAATPSYVLKQENEKSSTSTMTTMTKRNMDMLPILSKGVTSCVSSVYKMDRAVAFLHRVTMN